MSDSAKFGPQEVLRLPVGDCTVRMKDLIDRLDQPNPTMDALWLKEAEDRMVAYRAGDLDAVDAENAFAELGQQV